MNELCPNLRMHFRWWTAVYEFEREGVHSLADKWTLDDAMSSWTHEKHGWRSAPGIWLSMFRQRARNPCLHFATQRDEPFKWQQKHSRIARAIAQRIRIWRIALVDM